ncbi:MAG: type I DNA topoisomerase, partial [Nitrospinota bacterium]
MSKKLIIVESPAKASTIKKYLGSGYQVKASVGHVKDLPKSKLGVDVEKDFSPVYLTIKGKKKVLQELSSCAKKAEKVYLAPDPDREGEAIAWHIASEMAGEEDKIYRVLFNEITKKGVTEALANPKKINTNKVNAQQTRRILDRLVGYKISPLLWKKVRRGLSAGRVQSVALRLVCEREEEIQAFVKEEYWSITSKLNSKNPPPFLAKLFRFKGEKAEIKNEKEAGEIVSSIDGAPFKVESVQKKERKKNPVPPFITSTLQQEASSKFRFSAKKTMMLAQKLYEGLEIGEEGPTGLITYMRTDSFRIASDAMEGARTYIQAQYGLEYVPEKPNFYKSKKSAQEGHEAIRPTSIENTPEKVQTFLSKEELTLYKLIWNRFIASQMVPAILDLTTVDISAGKALFRATGSIVRFKGFTSVYSDMKGTKEAEEEGKDGILPPLEQGELLKLEEIVPRQHFTQPPPRYTEA